MKALRRAAVIALVLVAIGYALHLGLTSVPRVAILDDATPAAREQYWAAFRGRLAALGWSEGETLAVDARYANGDRSRLETLAGDIVARKPDVFVVATTTVALAAKKATSEIPIVVLGAADPVRSGLVASLGRPGGNVTGASFNQAEIVGKWLNLVRELVPEARAIAYLTDRGNPGEVLVFQELSDHARKSGMTAELFDGVTTAGVDDAFDALSAGRADALIVGTPSSILAQRKHILDAAAAGRTAVLYARREYADAGGVVSYGADFKPVFERGAEYVDRILRGAKPADLPYDMASSFRLVLNLRAARQMGLAIPESIRIRADEVIE
jgi:putative ABC transport system substrate-binding protein